MDFSVVIPAYKAEETIHRAVSSVLRQTLLPKEIIIVADDAQDYIALLKQSAIDSALIRAIRTGHHGSGAGNARNVGIEASMCDAVACLDADDAFHANRLHILAPLVQKFGVAWTALAVIDDVSKAACPIINAPLAGPAIGAPDLFRIGMHGLGHVAFDKRRVTSRFDQHSNLADIVFGYSVFNNVDAVGYSNEPLYDYYHREGSVCHSPNTANAMLKAVHQLKDPRHPTIPHYRAAPYLYQHLDWIAQAEYAWMHRENKQRSFEDFLAEFAQPLASKVPS
jgi:glycosyltransferase involved in cell wall biosynthesis